MKVNLEIVKRAREIITPEAAWTKGTYAKDADNHLVSIIAWDEANKKYIINPAAVCFCAIGAVRRAAFELAGDEYVDDFAEVAESCVPALWRLGGGGADIASFNDWRKTTHAQVLGMFDCVIAKLEVVATAASPSEAPSA